ncbi:DNA repair protein [Oceanicola sp. D3]|uniref:DNA repair protein n=1 Tax=Oceanicola sp. D3 TaxID=2587163 RepID=UPI001122F7AD|nr:DNA repair protein [Oceanicola sp. D3]QDC10202.1 DNA repair protein [Oceanicola sp. D3]
MTATNETPADRLFQALRALSLTAFGAIAIGLIGATLLAAFKVLPWLEASLTFGETTYENAGIWIQSGLTLFALALCAFLPANRHILALQKSHRDFHLSMDDIARAYATCHAADREGAFSMSSEFDAVRERMAFMRNHPDLRGLEPGVLEVAAQMSEVSRDLAAVYSDEKMTRATTFLRQRQEEIDAFSDRLKLAQKTTDEIKRWSQQINVEESIQATQLAQLEQDLLELLPELGFDVEEEALPPAHTDERKVVPMAAKPQSAKAKPAE